MTQMKQWMNNIRNTLHNNWDKLGIQKKTLLFFLSFALFVISIPSIFLTKSATKSIRTETTATLMEILDQTAIKVNYTFNQVEDCCFRMRTDWDLLDIYFRDKANYDYKQQNKDYYSLMDIYSSNMVNRNINDIRMFMDNGGFYLDIEWICRSFEQVYEQSWYPLEANDRYQWISYMDTQGEQPVFTISCVRALVKDSQIVGYMELRLNQERLHDILENVSEIISSNLYILNEEGIVYAASDDTQAGEAFRYQNEVILLRNLEQYEMALEHTNSELLILQRENVIIAAVVPEKVLLEGMSSFWISSIFMILLVLVIATVLSIIL